MSSEVDKIKEKIGISKLAEDERKQIFDKFVKAGGKVIDEKNRRSTVSFDREKQKELVKKLEEKKKSRKDVKNIDELEEKEGTNIEARLSFWDKLSIYLRGLTNKTITISGKYVNRKFFIAIEKEILPHIQRLNFVVRDIFSSDEKILAEIKKVLYAKERYYFELLKRYVYFYNEEEFNGLLYFYHKNPFKKITPKHIEEPLKNIFKKIYLLKDFVSGAMGALKSALRLAYTMRKVNNNVLTRRSYYIKQGINIIFYKLLPKIYSLSLINMKANVQLNSRRFEEYLDIKEEDKVGFKSYKDVFDEKESATKINEAQIIKSKVEFIKKSFKDLTSEDMDDMELDEMTKYGITLINKVDFQYVKDGCPTTMHIEECDENDKVLVTYLLLKEFETEYSFILTSYKISINQEFIDGKRVDYKAVLNSIYPKLTPIEDKFREYFETVHALNEIKKDTMINEIEKYNRINSLEGKRSKIGFEARKDTLEFIQEVKNYFDRFINDYNNEKNLIENPEEVLHFDAEVEGNKKVDGKKVIEVLIDADSFLTAMIFRLEDGGDLSGISTDIKGIDVPKEIESEEQKSYDDDFLDELSQVVETPGENK